MPALASVAVTLYGAASSSTTPSSYNEASNTWTALASIPGANGIRYLLSLNDMLVAVTSAGACYEYLLGTDSWTPFAPLTLPASNEVKSATAFGGKLYLAYGNTYTYSGQANNLVSYTPETSALSTPIELPMATFGIQLLAHQGKLLIWGTPEMPHPGVRLCLKLERSGVSRLPVRYCATV